MGGGGGGDVSPAMDSSSAVRAGADRRLAADPLGAGARRSAGRRSLACTDARRAPPRAADPSLRGALLLHVAGDDPSRADLRRPLGIRAAAAPLFARSPAERCDLRAARTQRL